MLVINPARRDTSANGLSVTVSQSWSALLFQNVDDSEFVRAMESEFKRWGYIVVIQLTQDPQILAR